MIVDLMIPIYGIYRRILKYGWYIVDCGKMNNDFMFFDIKGNDGMTRRVIFKVDDEQQDQDVGDI